MDRLTKQGIRDLNPVGHNGHRNHGSSCRHYFNGPLVVTGTRFFADPIDGSCQEEPIYERKCCWCPETKP